MRGHENQPSGGDPAPPSRPDFDGEFFEGMVAAASDAVVTVDGDGTVVYANDAVEDRLGYAPDDLLGRAFDEFVPERFEDRDDRWYEHPEGGSRDGDGDATKREDAAESDGTFEVTVRTADADERRLTMSAFEHRSDGERLVTGFLREAPEAPETPDTDATDERLREEEALVQEIFDTSPIAISVRDADGELLRANDRAAELVGVGTDDIPSDVDDYERTSEWTVYDEDGDPLPQEALPANRAVETGEPVLNEELVVERPDGSQVWLSVNATPIVTDGEVRQVVSTAEDITELKETQRALERRRAELETELSEVFARIDDAFFALNDEWAFTYVNAEAEELLDRTEGELLGKDLWEAFPEAVDSTFEREYRKAMATQEQTSFVEYFPPLSTWFEVRAYPSETGLSVYFRDVTDRIEREQQLERYETIVETVGDGVYALDSDERFVMVNDAFCEMTGYGRDELLGEHASVVHSETVSQRAAELSKEAAAEMGSATLEVELRTKDGSTIPVESRFGPYRYDDEGFARTGVVRDITERRRFEQTLTALHESSRELLQLETADAVCESVLQTTTDVLGIPGAGIYLWDDEASKLVPAAASEYVEDIFGDLPSFDPGDEAITWHAFAEGETVTLDDVADTDLAYRDDTPLRSGLWIPLGDHGVLSVVSEEVGAFGTDEEKLADLLAATTEAALDRVERERERREHERALEAQNERLDAFASMLAHELRNPLEIAQIYLGMGVERAVEDDADASAFEEVETALDRIEEMIETLLVVTRRGGEVDTAEVVNLGEVAVEWWERLDPDGSLAVETDRKIRADESRLRQLLENLYRNAEEHAGPDVSVRVGDLPDGFYVEDDGPGIPEDERGQVFDPGYSTSNVGIGFGLAVVRQLVEAHDWDCEITESEDGGARFEFTGVEVVEE
jgi:PAS domain S-box-containing protein